MRDAPTRSSDFDFALPPELIAQHPAAERSASRLLDGTRRRRRSTACSATCPTLLRAGDLLVFNDTRVIKARLLGVKASGGAVEALVERVLPDARGARAPARQQVAEAGQRDRASPTRSTPRCSAAAAPTASLFRLRFPDDPLALLERARPRAAAAVHHARRRRPTTSARYQTVFAARPGAVAAPTAALHFDAGVLAALRRARRRAARA